MSDSNISSIQKGGKLFRNTLWNLIGQVAPLLAAFFAIPILIKGLGVDRFGILTLAWMVIGYFSLFDLGLGRALIKLVSERLGAGKKEDIPELIWTALVLMSVLGILGAGIMLSVNRWLTEDILKISLDLQSEALDAFQVLAFSVPLVIITTGVRGVLEAYHRFDLVNIVRIPQGILTFIGPVMVLPFTNRLEVLVSVLLALRIFIFIIYGLMCNRVVANLFSRYSFSLSQAMPMLGFGGWMTLSNVVGPMMVYLDRFVIGSVLGMAAVAYYVTPYEILTKLLIIPGAVVGVLFPTFSATFAGARSAVGLIYWRSVRWIYLLLFPVILIISTFANEGFRLWLSNDFALNSTSVVQLLAVGVLINSLAHVPFAFIQGVGRPDLTAKLHLIELPFYLLMLWLLMKYWGIAGAALAWSLRALIDAIALFVVSARIDVRLNEGFKKGTIALIVGFIAIGIGTLPMEIRLKFVYLIVFLIMFLPASWVYLMTPEDRTLIRRYVRI